MGNRGSNIEKGHTSNDVEPDFIPVTVEDYGRTQRPGGVNGCPCEL